jgi:hypothetical protein
MKRVWAIGCILLLCAGCLSEADKAQWNECWRDFRGDNQRMRSDFGSAGNPDDSSLKP